MLVQMRNPGRSLIALGVLAAMAVLGAGPVVAGTVHVADDTFIRLGAGTNFGRNQNLFVRNVGPGGVRHAFMRFDLSTLPPGLPVPVSRAVMTFYVDSVADDGDNPASRRPGALG